MALNRLCTRAWKLNSAVALLIPQLVKRLDPRLCLAWANGVSAMWPRWVLEGMPVGGA